MTNEMDQLSPQMRKECDEQRPRYVITNVLLVPTNNNEAQVQLSNGIDTIHVNSALIRYNLVDKLCSSP